ncbi:hypothetical protein RF11_08465 [Thelohanellus kitauei]|uniref:Uncharacterized protein n=1 Tax=Thelohanellus kitauei TaxID=669202 RepID=A0A0C2IWM9_THEKT|nr:hypothetical protein RF11_08465 [Thelohanellus kitauei]
MLERHLCVTGHASSTSQDTKHNASNNTYTRGILYSPTAKNRRLGSPSTQTIYEYAISINDLIVESMNGSYTKCEYSYSDIPNKIHTSIMIAKRRLNSIQANNTPPTSPPKKAIIPQFVVLAKSPVIV